MKYCVYCVHRVYCVYCVHMFDCVYCLCIIHCVLYCVRSIRCVLYCVHRNTLVSHLNPSLHTSTSPLPNLTPLMPPYLILVILISKC